MQVYLEAGRVSKIHLRALQKTVLTHKMDNSTDVGGGFFLRAMIMGNEKVEVIGLNMQQ